ncbi:MAG: ABC transporter substrate-binding protein, partial [Planctomycetaceae bacterium]
MMTPVTKRFFSLSLLLPLAVALIGCSDSSTNTSPPPNDVSAANSPASVEKIQLQLNWFPEAEHGGFYAADLNGHYTAAGIEVTILPGGPNAAVIQKVDQGDVEFAVASADQVLTGRAGGAKVVAVFAPLQMSPRCIMVHEKSGIKSLAELKGVTLAMSPGA